MSLTWNSDEGSEVSEVARLGEAEEREQEKTARRRETLDLRGLICPEPVLRAKSLLDSSSVAGLTALVDSEVNVNNLQRLASSLKMSFASRFEDGSFKVSIERSTPGQSDSEKSAESRSTSGLEHTHAGPSPTGGSTTGTKAGTVVLINRESFGEGDSEFSAHLLNIFLQTAYRAGQRPQAILLANSGVKLMNSASFAYEVLQEFKNDGCEVLACGLCVEYYGLTEQVPKEQITNMFAICEYMFSAERLIVP